MLLLNRRGFSTFVACRSCGERIECVNCSVTLTYHRRDRRLLCHYCNLQVSVLHSCPQCGGKGIRYFGLGTEKVMTTIQQSFPTARLLRWDKDTASNYRAHQQLRIFLRRSPRYVGHRCDLGSQRSGYRHHGRRRAAFDRHAACR